MLLLWLRRRLRGGGGGGASRARKKTKPASFKHTTRALSVSHALATLHPTHPTPTKKHHHHPKKHTTKQDIAVSSGSACTSASLEPSYVLRALGVEEERAHTSIRAGLGRFTTPEVVDVAVARTVAHVDKLRAMSPLWEMVQEGIDLKSIQWTQH